MYKYYIVSLFAVFTSLTAANANTRDSIGVENYNGKKLIVHQVIAKDTYYSIGRRYNVVPKDIMLFNDSKFLQIGVIIKVPTNVPFNGSAAPVIANKNKDSKNNQTEDTAADGATLVEHTVQKKENLNMLAEKYGTTVNEIKKANNLNSINLQIGQVLKIPAKNAVEESPVETASNQKPVVTSAVIDKSNKKAEVAAAKKDVAADQNKPLNSNAPAEEFIEHTVASNETIYSIATRYKLTIDQLKAKNNLSDNGLIVGQKLLIKGQYPPKPAARVVNNEKENNTDTLSSIKNPSLRLPASRYGLNQIDEKGTGVWIADPDLDPSKMLVLHRTAPIGTVMKITNPMNNRSTFAKVVGKFTENETTKDVVIVMTQAVADALGALDKRFFCNLTYGGQDNEQ